MTQVVVTGASGFIGGALCPRLEKAGAEVRRVRAYELRAMPAMPRAVCVHLAANNNAQALEKNESTSWNEATTLAKQVLEKKFRRVVFASSALVYGDGDAAPRTEASPLEPKTAYGRLKAELENLFSSGDYACARISNVYGRGMSETNVVSHVLSQLRAGDRVNVRNLSSVRDYLHVDDAADALVALAVGTMKGAFNVSTGRGVSIAELITLSAQAGGRRNVKSGAEAETGVPSTLVLDPARLTAACGWKAIIRLEQGLAGLMEAKA